MLFKLGAPYILRCDMGSENAHIAFLQPFLRRNVSDCFAGEHSIQPSNMIITVLCAEDRGMVVTFERSFTTWGIDLFHVREKQ